MPMDFVLVNTLVDYEARPVERIAASRTSVWPTWFRCRLSRRSEEVGALLAGIVDGR
jgi:hypothetical protein